MIDKRPAAIARCRDAADVIACVRFAREHGVEIAVRGGGHNAAGLGVGGRRPGHRPVAAAQHHGRPRATTPSASTPAAPGATSTTRPSAFGMATPSGFLASTGVAGLTLGGGIGYLSRRFGLTVDNLLSADVVLADGTFVTASENSHTDLFWALRGGGGNFGIVTSFTFRCHDIGEHGTIIGGPVLYDFADTAEVMRWYRELLPSLPEELSGWIALLTIPPAPPFPEELWGRKACGIVWCYTGPHDRADEVLEPVRTFGSPLVVGLQPCRSPRCRARSTPLYPAGLQWYWRADFFNEISDAAIDVHVKYGAQLPTGHSTMHMYPIDGAASRVPEDATAFAYRDGGWAGVIVGRRPRPGQRRRHLAVGPRLLGGAAPDLRRRRLRQLPDGRGPGPGQGVLPRQLRPARPDQASATTRTTPSTSTRTSSPPAGPTCRPVGRGRLPARPVTRGRAGSRGNGRRGHLRSSAIRRAAGTSRSSASAARTAATAASSDPRVPAGAARRRGDPLQPGGGRVQAGAVVVPVLVPAAVQDQQPDGRGRVIGEQFLDEHEVAGGLGHLRAGDRTTPAFSRARANGVTPVNASASAAW